MMRAYTEQLVAVCHRRGAHAIGGMAAAIPSRRPRTREGRLDSALPVRSTATPLYIGSLLTRLIDG